MAKILNVQDLKNNNSVLAALNIKNSDTIVAVRENDLADANFVITHLIKSIFHEDSNQACLVITHNTLGHYHNVGKRLGYDFLKKIQDGKACVLEPLAALVENIDNEEYCDNLLSESADDVAKRLFLQINETIGGILKKQNAGHVYLIIDDLSHLFDLNADVRSVTAFINYCVGLTSSDRVSLVVATHVSDVTSEIVANALGYVADVVVDVSPLKTGISHDVTGVLTVKRTSEGQHEIVKHNVYHYKAYDREIKAFAPGESLNYLYK